MEVWVQLPSRVQIILQLLEFLLRTNIPKRVFESYQDMELENRNIAVIIGHPGHELRIYRFIEIYKPRVYVITDGSGSTGISRINKTKEILNNCGAGISPVMGYFTDREIYQIILQNNIQPLITLLQVLLDDLKKHNIQVIAGDAYEGYNPSHDLCRYLINLVVQLFKQKWGIELLNFDFLLDRMSPADNTNKSILIKLDDSDFERKFSAAQQYSELSKEVNYAVSTYGKDAFKCERLSLVEDNELIQSQDTPFYEKYGLEKINEGAYQEVISYSNHLLPLIKKLKRYVDDHPELL